MVPREGRDGGTFMPPPGWGLESTGLEPLGQVPVDSGWVPLPSQPVTPGSGACLLRSWESVVGLSQLLGRKKSPSMTLPHPKE